MIPQRPRISLLVPLIWGIGCASSDLPAPEDTDSSGSAGQEDTSDGIEVPPAFNDVTVNVLWGDIRDTEAVGTLWIGVYSELPDSLPEEITEEPFMVTSVEIDAGSASVDTLLASHLFEDLPVTTDLYYLNIFLDTNGNAELPVPIADSGDVWARGGVSSYPGFSAAATEAETQVTLSFVLP